MFRGAFTAHVDKKRQLAMPASFKREINERFDNQCFITSATGHQVDIYPLSEWKKIEEALLSDLGQQEAVQSFLQKTAYYGEQAAMDPQGRLKLPERLCVAANIAPGSDVVVFGHSTMLKATNREQFQAALSQEITTADRQVLAEAIQAHANRQKDSDNAS